VIEVADVFRRFAPDYLAAHGASMLPSHQRAITDILACRTEALGGHLWRCDQCSAGRFSYHSCIMGKISNGELAGESLRFLRVAASFALHYGAFLKQEDQPGW